MSKTSHELEDWSEESHSRFQIFEALQHTRERETKYTVLEIRINLSYKEVEIP